MCGDRPKDWMKWLTLAEFWYNTNFHSAIQTTPFEVVYGQPPPLHVAYSMGDSKVAPVDRTLTARENAIGMVKFHLQISTELRRNLQWVPGFILNYNRIDNCLYENLHIPSFLQNTLVLSKSLPGWELLHTNYNYHWMQKSILFFTFHS